jgi:2-polyprenyl-6-methoxyphenol hydroxylase-like FAD-dependent oxidoreductase
MAIEDSVVLARCFVKYGLSEDALRGYERVRHGRTSAITYVSRLYGDIGQWENPFATATRSKVISALPRGLDKQFDEVCLRLRCRHSKDLALDRISELQDWVLVQFQVSAQPPHPRRLCGYVS